MDQLVPDPLDLNRNLTVLKDACFSSDKAKIKMIVEQRPDLINEVVDSDNGNTLLIRACVKGWSEIVKYLISNHSNTLNINQQNKYGQTALHWAILRNSDNVEMLLTHPNLGVNLQSQDGKTALYLAVRYGRQDCVRLLLNHPNLDLSIRYEMPLLWSCGNRDCYELLLPFFPTMNEDDKRMAWLSSLCHDKNDVNPLKDMMLQIPTYILPKMSDDLGKLVGIAIEIGNFEALEYLFSRYSDFINVNIQDKHGMTALHKATRWTNVNCLRLVLLHPKIDLNIQDEYGRTALHLAVIGGKLYCVRFLLSYANINVDLQDKGGRTVLHQAISGGKVRCATLLLAYPTINVNLQDKDGKTALHEAVSYNCVSSINSLLNNPTIDVTVKDKEGRTANEVEIREFQDPSIKMKIKVLSVLPHQQLVRWNHSKIMLVGQGRAGKTALANNLAGRWMGETSSTIGAEQMDMKLLFGGVRGGRLEEYERPKQELEALLAELSYFDINREHDFSTLRTDSSQGCLVEAFNKSDHKSSSEVTFLSHTDYEYHQTNAETSIMEPKRSGKETSFTSPLTLNDIKFDKVDLYYRKLQEVETTSGYKLLLLDFGGQSMFNVLHGFFMSRYGIYLMVFDMELFLSTDAAERDSCRKEMKFWLNSITMHTLDNGKTAPVAIVGTRGDKVSREEDHEHISSELEDMFGEMQLWESLVWYEISGKEGRLCFFPNNNVLTRDNPVSQELLRSIEENLRSADYMKIKIPMLWIKMFDEMKEQHRSYLSYEEVLKMVQQKFNDETVERIVEEQEIEEGSNIIDGMEESEIELIMMLRFLNDMGMLMWIEETGLEDVIILDPIDYLVKPATTIVCKHLATKDDPYRTKHEIAEIHGESKKEYGEDWMRMLEYGVVSELLARDLLRRYYKFTNTAVSVKDNNITTILSYMVKFGLMVPLFSSTASSERLNNRNLYFVPSLLPANPSLLDDNIQDRNIQKLLCRLRLRYKKMDESWTIGMRYSLFCFLPREELSVAKSIGKSRSPVVGGIKLNFKVGGYDVISSSELSQQGFLPHSLFERLICRFIQFIGAHEDMVMDRGLLENEIITGFQGKVQLTYKHHSIRMIERREENRIEVIIEAHDANRLSAPEKDSEKEVFIEIYERSVEMMELLLRECYEGLQVKTLLHLPQTSLAASNGLPDEGLVSLRKVRELLLTTDSFLDSKSHHLNSYDAKCEITLITGEMKKYAYWSVWKEKVKIPTSHANSSSTSSSFSCSSAPTLTGGKKTHVFLSHDWGIDGNNHHRVKQVSEALKSRGLVTWIDEERLVNEIDEKIIDGIDHTECMLVFVTENYIRKVSGENDLDYCKREFKYGCSRLGVDRLIVVVLDEAMKDTRKWHGLIRFNLGSVLYYDLSTIFEAVSCESEESVNELMDGLYEKIFITITGHKPQRQSKTWSPFLPSLPSDSSSSFLALFTIVFMIFLLVMIEWFK